MRPTNEKLAELARIVAETTGEEIDCEQLLGRVAAYLRAVADGGELSPPLQQVAQHLRVCPECSEEFIALVRAEGLDPATFRPIE